MRDIQTRHSITARKLAFHAQLCGTWPQIWLSAHWRLLPMTGISLALPKSCVIRNYFQTAEMDNQVGMRSSCPGANKWGKITKFVEVETVDLVPDGPSGPGGGPGKLPCEFLASGCSNLPELRH